MNALHLALGVVTVVLGGSMVVKRNAITAHHQKKAAHAQVPMLWLVHGALLALVGVTQLIIGIS